MLKKILKQIYWSINFQYTFKLNGTRIRGLKIYHAKTKNIDELWMGQILGVLLKQNNGAFLDVGVNIGQTLCQVKSIDFQREYFGFEPNPACNMFVEELVRINKFPCVKIFPVGIFTEDSIFIMPRVEIVEFWVMVSYLIKGTIIVLRAFMFE